MTKIEIGSGNVFKDLGYKDHEEALTKAKVAVKINQIIKKRGYTQKQAAEILSVDQPKISYIKNGRLRGFSLEKLFAFLNALDHEVEIIIREKPAKSRASHAGMEVVSTYV